MRISAPPVAIKDNHKEQTADNPEVKQIGKDLSFSSVPDMVYKWC